MAKNLSNPQWESSSYGGTTYTLPTPNTNYNLLYGNATTVEWRPLNTYCVSLQLLGNSGYGEVRFEWTCVKEFNSFPGFTALYPYLNRGYYPATGYIYGNVGLSDWPTTKHPILIVGVYIEPSSYYFRGVNLLGKGDSSDFGDFVWDSTKVINWVHTKPLEHNR